MECISHNPTIMLDYTSDTERTLLFDMSVINADIRHFHQLAEDVNTQSAGGILVHLEDLPHGRLRICWNPVPRGKMTLDDAIGIFHKRLREVCSFSKEFNPTLRVEPREGEEK